MSQSLPILTSEGSSRGHGPYITEANEPLADRGQKVPVTVFRDTGDLEPNINQSVLPLFLNDSFVLFREIGMNLLSLMLSSDLV